MFSVSVLGVVLAAVACFIIGFLFHGPLFGKLWIKLADIHPTGNEKFSDMYGQMFWNFVSNLVAAYVLAVIINIGYAANMSASKACIGIISAILIWLAVSASSSIEVIWMKRKVSLWSFELVSSLVCFIAMGLVLVFL